MDRLAREVTLTLPYRWQEVDPGHFAAHVGVERGWRVILNVCAGDDAIHCAASFGSEIDKDWIQRKLALALLAMNNDLERGSFRLVQNENGCLFLLGERCRPKFFDRSALRVVCEELVRETRQALRRLYSQEVIDVGPDVVSQLSSTPHK